MLWVVDFTGVGDWTFHWVVGASRWAFGFTDLSFGWWRGDESWQLDRGADMDTGISDLP